MQIAFLGFSLHFGVRYEVQSVQLPIIALVFEPFLLPFEPPWLTHSLRHLVAEVASEAHLLVQPLLYSLPLCVEAAISPSKKPPQSIRLADVQLPTLRKHFSDSESNLPKLAISFG